MNTMDMVKDLRIIAALAEDQYRKMADANLRVIVEKSHRIANFLERYESHEEVMEAVRISVCNTYAINPHELATYNKRSPLNDARKTIAGLLSELGYTVSEIARFMARDRATVMYNIANQVPDDEYRSKYAQAKAALEKAFSHT